MSDGPPDPPPSASSVARAVFVTLGVLCVALGAVGVFVPGLPTTPFLLLASFLFARSSPRLLSWLDGHRLLGPYLRAFRGGGGVPLRAKIVTFVLLWGGILTTFVLLADRGVLRWPHVAALVAVALAVSWYVGLRLPTSRR